MKYLINRSPYASEHRVLSSNGLKIIAAIAMVIDHVGVYLLGNSEIYLSILFRILGRLAFPLFAYCIAEGCRYTRNKQKRFWIIFLMGVAFEAVWVGLRFFSEGGFSLLDTYGGDPIGFLKFIRSECLEGNIFLTFSCSILLIYIVQAFKKGLADRDVKRSVLYGCLFPAALAVMAVINYLMNGLNYGVAGIILPVLVALVDYDEGKAPKLFKPLDHPWVKLALFAVGLIFLSATSSMKVIQSFCLLSLIPLALYNGKPGSGKMKWWFYIFYPAHLVIIWFIGLLIK